MKKTSFLCSFWTIESKRCAAAATAATTQAQENDERKRKINILMVK